MTSSRDPVVSTSACNAAEAATYRIRHCVGRCVTRRNRRFTVYHRIPCSHMDLHRHMTQIGGSQHGPSLPCERLSDAEMPALGDQERVEGGACARERLGRSRRRGEGVVIGISYIDGSTE